MSEESEFFQKYKDDQKERRAVRLPVRQEEIEGLDGYEVKKLTAYQFRVNGVLDLYPIHKRWHNIKTGKRGNYKTALEIVKLQVRN